MPDLDIGPLALLVQRDLHAGTMRYERLVVGAIIEWSDARYQLIHEP